ncbi:MAG TPA: hypothetical protein VFK32_10235 [Tepidiformaceae bacterium]|nr:hypothetical protein [Tepidiformaceae bacterium]
MSAYRIAGIPSNRLLLVIAVVAGIAIFAGGAVAGRALGGDEPRSVTRLNIAQPSSNAPASQDDGGGTDAILTSDEAKRAANSYATGAEMRYWPYCPSTLPAGVVGEAIDPAAAGIAMKLLGSGFELQSITLRSEGECDEAGNTTGAHPVLESTWTHSATEATVWVQQRESDEETANYIDQYMALVWNDGYVFQISVSGGYHDLIMEKEAARAGDDATRSSFPAPEFLTDEEAAAVLADALGQLAPGVAMECFYRIVLGDWDDVAAIGLGDPRAALPDGYTESYMNIRILEAPAASCGAPELEGYYGASFDASFTDSQGGWIGVSAYQLPDDQPMYPGSSTAGSVYWSDANWQYNIYGYSADGTPIDAATLSAIATAFVPGFDGECLAQDRELSSAEIVAAGFGEPVVPDGFTLQKSQTVVNAIPDGCETPENTVAGGYRLSWLYTDAAGASLDISVNLFEGQAGDLVASGYINDFGAGWTRDDGASFNIWTSSASAEAPISREELLAVAQSIDPSLDPATLSEDGGGVRPMPAKPPIAE